jgi:splicing factor 3B subunit 2
MGVDSLPHRPDSTSKHDRLETLKAKTCERVQPKMGKINIGYQKFCNVFCRFQTKPPLTSFGKM